MMCDETTMTGAETLDDRNRPWWRRLFGRLADRGVAAPADLTTENARLRRAVAELSLINDTAREIAGSLDSSNVVERIIHRARKAVDAEQAAVVLVDADAGGEPRTLVRTVTLQGSDPIWHLDEQLLGWMSAHRQPLLSNQPQSDDRLDFARIPASVRQLLCVPLLVKGELTGVLSAVNRRGGGGFTDQDERLLGIIAAQSAQVVEAARLYEHERTLADVQQELRSARRIQQHLVPAKLPDIPGYDLAALFHAAGEVGGDCYDCLPGHAGTWAVCMFDVSGKGVPAALLAANLHAVCRTRITVGDLPADCLVHLNEHLLASSALGEFASCFLGILDPDAHRFVYSAAGHEPALLARRQAATAEMVERLATGNLLLGVLPDHEYRDGQVDLEPGDVLIAYTDGITDVFDAAGERFGSARLAAVVHRECRATAEEIAGAILAAVQEHGGADRQPDDQALVILKRRYS